MKNLDDGSRWCKISTSSQRGFVDNDFENGIIYDVSAEVVELADTHG